MRCEQPQPQPTHNSSLRTTPRLVLQRDNPGEFAALAREALLLGDASVCVVAEARCDTDALGVFRLLAPLTGVPAEDHGFRMGQTMLSPLEEAAGLSWGYTIGVDTPWEYCGVTFELRTSAPAAESFAWCVSRLSTRLPVTIRVFSLPPAPSPRLRLLRPMATLPPTASFSEKRYRYQ